MSTDILFSQTIFQAKRQDTGKIHICLASDICTPRSNVINLNPSRLGFESYCRFLKNKGILDLEGKLNLGFSPLVEREYLFWTR